MAKASTSADERLATYGTLAPGQINHHQLSDLTGDWREGTVRGRLVDAGWGAAHGCPGLILDPEGDDVDVHIFQSPDLPDHWPRLDEFEGPGYRRVVTQVQTKEGDLEASIYTIVTRPPR